MIFGIFEGKKNLLNIGIIFVLLEVYVYDWCIKVI